MSIYQLVDKENVSDGEVDGKENEGLKRMLEEALETRSKELYFKRIALHLEGAISANLAKSATGQ